MPCLILDLQQLGTAALLYPGRCVVAANRRDPIVRLLAGGEQLKRALIETFQLRSERCLFDFELGLHLSRKQRLHIGQGLRLLRLPLGPSPLFGRVGVHSFTFDACSSFTHVTACRMDAAGALSVYPLLGWCTAG